MANLNKLTKSELISLVEKQEESKRKLSEKMKEVMNREEVKSLVTDKVKEYYQNNSHVMKGKTFSEEAKENMKLGQKLKKAQLTKDVVLQKELLSIMGERGIDINQDRYKIVE